MIYQQPRRPAGDMGRLSGVMRTPWLAARVPVRAPRRQELQRRPFCDRASWPTRTVTPPSATARSTSASATATPRRFCRATPRSPRSPYDLRQYGICGNADTEPDSVSPSFHQRRIATAFISFPSPAAPAVCCCTRLRCPAITASGDLGPAAYRFVDFLAVAGQTWWQMLPVNPPGDAPGNSPYSSHQRVRRQPVADQPGTAGREGLLDAAECARRRSSTGTSSRISHRATRFAQSTAAPGVRPLRSATVATRRVESFVAQASRVAGRLVALRRAARRRTTAHWYNWPSQLRLREPDAHAPTRDALARESPLSAVRAVRLRSAVDTRCATYCHERGVGLIGDIPIFVAHDSADVWAHRELFLLDRARQAEDDQRLSARRVQRARPDVGPPAVRLAAHSARRFAWWVSRFARDAATVRRRADRPFPRLPPHVAHPVRRDGREARQMGAVAGRAAVHAVREARRCPRADHRRRPRQAHRRRPRLRDRFGFPGMRIMQFGFGAGGEIPPAAPYPQRLRRLHRHARQQHDRRLARMSCEQPVGREAPRRAASSTRRR